MLIQEKLKRRESFSNVENVIADYILERGAALKNESARHIAAAVFAAPSSIVRFCQKLGYSGYAQFQKAWLKELDYLSSHFQNVDANRPFEPADPICVVANKLSTLYQETIADTLSLQHAEQLAQAVRYCNQAKVIYFCSAGAQSGIAAAFEGKMAKIGKTVLMASRNDVLFHHACNCDPNDCFILFSYSGETPNILRVAQKLKKRKVHTVVITSFGNNTLANWFTCKLFVSTRERLVSNLGSFSTHLSALFLLDLIYAGIMNQDFEYLYHVKQKNSQEFEQFRHSENPILQDLP